MLGESRHRPFGRVGRAVKADVSMCVALVLDTCHRLFIYGCCHNGYMDAAGFRQRTGVRVEGFRAKSGD
ncbi:hypothetical protein SBA1_280002 [Candidatus Sulfotelmatobacter kueseliae]|uniref:Uncharacterized protein n=1 Tax=Candidatus Sulfotelmatobacter kueseliae TaxID=2042962 RepID=A0A2U3KIK5_9BACT|nr:hypothetical protein SBA1_280002 [Candidatus Sulfotelmatobacter kueseliae]